MKTLTKTLAISAVVVSITGFAIAEVVKPLPLQPINSNSNLLKLQRPHHYCQHNKGKVKLHAKQSVTGSWFHTLHRLRQLTPEEAKTVAQAAVILYGNDNIRVGNIKAVPGKHAHQNYQVQIINKEGKVLNTVTMNGINGKAMPAKIHKQVQAIR